MKQSATFVFENDRVYALVNGKVVASASDVEELEAKLNVDEETEKVVESLTEQRYTHITTPNGLKGQILGRSQDVWGDTVTVRFENGRIATFHVDESTTFSSEITPAKENPVAKLKFQLEASVDSTEDGLIARLTELAEIKKQARHLIAQGVSYEDEQRLDDMTTQAEYEEAEVADALAQIDDDSIEPYAPPAPQVFEQETVGVDSDGGWLDDTLNGMIEEAEAQNFDQLIDEGPETFVADLETPALADSGVVRQLASKFVSSKTAGLDREAVQEFETAFLARVEQVRRAELTNRKEKIAKEASAEEGNHDGPADALFL